jgi:hypothetical protein
MLGWPGTVMLTVDPTKVLVRHSDTVPGTHRLLAPERCDGVVRCPGTAVEQGNRCQAPPPANENVIFVGSRE